MKLKNLEIAGFKSFSNRVNIAFDEGITGIVGPNGCGKSNIVDAIRWVLGEKKMNSLRSEKMENLIFNGSKSKKISQFCEVSLTFDNTKNILPINYSQVQVTRRYYRSGESECLLNSVPCRMKDITNLFLDTGINSNSYAVIELKMIEDLLSIKKNTRRELFEEAAGVSKFKLKKKETVNKLDNMASDLDRVEDVLYEIEKNLQDIKKQAKKAKKYFELKEKLKKNILAKSLIELRSFDTHLSELKDKKESDEKMMMTLSSKILEKDAVSEGIKSQLIQIEKSLASKQKSLNDLSQNINEVENKKKIKNIEFNHLRERLDTLKSKITQNKEQKLNYQKSLNDIEDKINVYSKGLISFELEVHTLKIEEEQKAKGNDDIREELKEKTAEFEKEKEKKHQISKTLDIDRFRLNDFHSNIQESEKSTQEKKEQLLLAQTQQVALNSDLDIKSRDLKKWMDQEERIESQITLIQQKKGELDEKLNHLLRKIDAKNNEYSLLKSLIDKNEGFPVAIKFLKNDADFKTLPILSDILSCHETYRIALENYLDPYLNHFVASYKTEALKAIHLLSQANQGKANFFVLEDVPKIAIQKNDYPNLIFFLDILEFDPSYTTLIQNLFSNVYIYENVLPSVEDSRIVLVEKNGTVIKKKFSVYGGSIGLFEGKKVGRLITLEKIENEIKRLNSKKNNMQILIREMKSDIEILEKSSQKTTIDKTKSEIDKIKNQLFILKKQEDEFEKNILNINSKNQGYKKTISLLQRNIGRQSGELERKIQCLNSTDEQLKKLKNISEAKEKQLLEHRLIFNKKNIEYHQNLNQLESYKKEKNFYNNELHKIDIALVQDTKSLENTLETIKNMEFQHVKNEDKIIELIKEKNYIELIVKKIEENYYEEKNRVIEIERKIKVFQREKEKVQENLQQVLQNIDKIDLQIDAIKEKNKVTYDVTVDSLEDEEISQLSRNELHKTQEGISHIKQKIEKLEPINHMAMQAYEEIKKRRDFINNQKNDLLNARESLNNTINEIDTVAEKTFLQTFEKIRTNFKNVFGTLFNENDNCDLILTHPENILESQIEILAQPKGKKPLNINQLSGGEKALTSIALLFSLYLLKPAPFCIFDEVDAPLDDNNINKFNRIIKKFSDSSQFIIITHNKNTMSNADVIYGITMQEQGVSSLIPVNLREIEKA